jgi:hypothetical protein
MSVYRVPLSWRLASVLCLFLLMAAASCGRRDPDRRSAGRATGGSPPPPAGTPGRRIEVEDGSGKRVFALSESAGGYEVLTEGKRQAGSIKVQEDRVKASNESGQPACKVKMKEDGFKLYREPMRPGGADVELLELKVAGGDFRIKDPRDQVLYHGRKGETKTKVSGPGGRQLVAKLKEDGVEVEDGSGTRLVRVKGFQSVPAAVFCASEYDLLEKAAVVAYCARFRL